LLFEDAHCYQSINHYFVSDHHSSLFYLPVFGAILANKGLHFIIIVYYAIGST